MSYELISEVNSRAKKRYRCIWCGETIEPGDLYVREFSKFDGDIQHHKWHPECSAAAAVYFREVDTEFSPWDNERPPTPGAVEFDSWDCALLAQGRIHTSDEGVKAAEIDLSMPAIHIGAQVGGAVLPMISGIASDMGIEDRFHMLHGFCAAIFGATSRMVGLDNADSIVDALRTYSANIRAEEASRVLN